MKESVLPLSLTVKIEATNGNTTRYALEAVVEILKNYQYLQAGQVFEERFWRATILESQDCCFPMTKSTYEGDKENE